MRNLFVFLFFWLAALSICAQTPVADFTASKTSGCAALAVSFTDKSSGNPRFWSWDFGNGQLANIQNPSTSYSIPGLYTVKLVVRNENGADIATKTNYIEVFPSPVINFSADKRLVCKPAVVEFTDLSTYTAGTILTREWNFGDGSPPVLNVVTPTHTYDSIGYFNVSLKITTNTGCDAATTAFRYIRVVPGISTDFINLPTVNCNAPFSVSFKNQSSGPGNVTYSWSFGNGNTSTVKDPTTTYLSATSYTVKLTAQSDFGCSGTKEKVINLASTVTDFTAPVNACPNAPITFTNNSSVLPISSTWTFSDGVQVQQKNATRSFPAPGTYTIKLVNKYSDCTDSVTKSITIIPEPVIDFSVDKTTSCKAPFTVNFTDNSPDGNQWQWDFGDGILGTGKTVQHTYNREGVFNVTLNLQTSTGCKGSKTRAAMITITRPVVKIGNVPAGGCAPYNYSPLATITSVEPIQSYGWDFGDGGTATGAMPTYPYITTGKFTLKLTITTTGGCTETVTIPNAVKVGTKPVVDFTTTPPPSVPPALTCAADSIQFTNLAAPAEEFIWRFGDGSDTSMKKNPKHKFIAPGSIPVTLVAINNGCADSITKTIVNIKPPVAKFDYTVNCAASGGIKVDFVNQSIPDVGTTYLWQFGDPANSTNSNIGPVSFTYPSEDIYTAKLIVSSTNGCRPDTFTRKINLRTEKASFKITDSTVCRNQPFTLTATNTNPGKVKTYQWKIGNIITYANDTINKLDTLVSVRGIYPVELTIIDTNLCTSTLLIPNYLKVLSPRANFSAVNNGGCVNAPILFADSSVSTVPVKKWTFDFGDEQSQIFTAPPFRHTYSQTGIYNVRLIAEDAESCADTILKPFSVNITRPRANFGTEFTNFCANKNLQFVDSSSGGVNFTYLWDFGDGTTSNLPNPAHQYATRTTPYTVKLTITDQFGCSDVITRTNYITIATPKAAFDIKDTIAICPPLETKFTFKGTGYASFYWVLGNGTDTLDIKDPTFFYNDYGTFVAKLVVEGNGGCIDSATRNVYVYNPATSVNISYPPTKVCNEATINFTISTPPNTSFVFYYGDQGADSTQRKTLSRLYNFPGTYSPYVELRDIYGCTANVGGPTPIQILGSIPVFSASGKKFCDSAIVFFNNFSLDNDPPVSYLWNFGDGTTSTDFEPFYRYTTPGLYSVSLEATTKSSCVKVFTDTIRIFRTPQPIITSIDTICLNTPVFFEGSLAVPDTAIKWRWLLSDGRMDSVPKTVFGFKTPGAYTIQLAAKNSFGCADTSSKSFTIQPLPKITLPPTVSIGIGKSIEIPATYTGTIRSYTWMPTEKLSCSDCPKPIANPQFTTTYRIKVIDENSCSDVKDITIKVICDNSNFFIPNTFSPNTDGVNDRFYPRGNGIERIQSFRIFNRWGQLVYDKREFAINDSSVGWDGTQNGKPAAADTYVYMIDLICENAVIVNYKGNITLIR